MTTPFLAGRTILADDFVGVAVRSVASGTLAGTVDTAVYTPTRTSATTNPIGIAFQAPKSGKVMIHIHTKMRHSASATNVLLTSFQVRTGATIGSGTIIHPVNDELGIQHSGTTDEQMGTSYLLIGLTWGVDYNVELQYRRSGSNPMTVTSPSVHVVPVLA